MNTLDVIRTVTEMVADILCVPADEVDAGEHLSDLGLNSVDLLDVVVKLETKFKVRFEPGSMKDLSVDSLAGNIAKSLAIQP